jgi:hypothetical protein
MENNETITAKDGTKAVGKTTRELVILSLKKDHAEVIKQILGEHLCDNGRHEGVVQVINKVYGRIEKALNRLKAQEVESSGAIEAVLQAAEEVSNGN